VQRPEHPVAVREQLRPMRRDEVFEPVSHGPAPASGVRSGRLIGST
jgi:hypothetical protein